MAEKEKEVLEEKNNYLKMVSVTEVLSIFSDFGHIPTNILEMASQRGIGVHSACFAYSMNLFPSPLPEDWRGYFESFKKWFDRSVSRVFFAEERFEDPHLGFYGHPDLGVELKEGFEFKRPIIDLKTPAVDHPSWRAQTAAYMHLSNYNFGPNFFDGHMVLQLDSGGRIARALPYRNQVRDFTAFMSALNCYRYFKL